MEKNEANNLMVHKVISKREMRIPLSPTEKLTKEAVEQPRTKSTVNHGTLCMEWSLEVLHEQ
jgi:hypothetical protein